jgi:hypothetical protein
MPSEIPEGLLVLVFYAPANIAYAHPDEIGTLQTVYLSGLVTDSGHTPFTSLYSLVVQSWRSQIDDLYALPQTTGRLTEPYPGHFDNSVLAFVLYNKPFLQPHR